MSLVRRAAVLVLLGFTAAPIVACSSDAAPDATAPRVAMNRANCVSMGIDVESCPPDTGGDDDGPPLPIHHGTTTPTTLCTANKACSVSLKTPSGTYDPAWVPDAPGSLNFIKAPGFLEALQAAGCHGEHVYDPGLDFSPSLAYALCPTMPALPASPLIGTIACDVCTGAAPAGWVIFAWELSPDPYVLKESGGAGGKTPHPGPGCDDISCVGYLQQKGSGGGLTTPLPVPSPLQIDP